MKMNFNGVDKLVIYGNGEILFTKTRDLNKVENAEHKSTGNGEIISFNLAKEPKNARKENLNRKDNYFLSYYDTLMKWHRRALYIHVSEISVEPLGEYVAFESKGETHYKDAHKLTFLNGGEIRVLHAEKMLVPDDWKIPEEEAEKGAHWSAFLGDHDNSYSVPSKESRRFHQMKGDKDYNLIHWYYTMEPLTENYYSSDFYTRTEYSEERKELKRIAAIMTECMYGNDRVYDSNVERMLEKLNITIKAEQPETEPEAAPNKAEKLNSIADHMKEGFNGIAAATATNPEPVEA